MRITRLGNVFQQVLKARHGLMGLFGRPEGADMVPIVLDKLIRLPKAALQILVLEGRQQKLGSARC
jgi:hypothetical protein